MLITPLSIFKDLLGYRNLLSLRGLSLFVPSALMSDFIVGSYGEMGLLGYISLLALIYCFVSSYSFGLTMKVSAVNLVVELRSNPLVRPSIIFGILMAITLFSLKAISTSMYPESGSAANEDYVNVIQLVKDRPVSVFLFLVFNTLVKVSFWAYVMFAMLPTLNSSINVQAQGKGAYYPPFKCLGIIFGGTQKTCWIGFGLLLLQSLVELLLLNHILMTWLVSTLLLFFIITWVVSVVIAEIGVGRHQKQTELQEEQLSSLNVVEQT